MDHTGGAVPGALTVVPLLEARGLSAPLDGPAPVLSGVNFELRARERVLLTGPSGSGKTTLLRCLVLLERCRGEVRLDGEPVGPARVRELRRRVAWVPQRPVAVAPTVEENLAFARQLGGSVPGSGRGNAMTDPSGGDQMHPGLGLDGAAQDALLDRLGLSGLDRDRRFDGLSGGEQQRVALVRSLTPGPQVLLLDEPTASLDPESVADVLAVVEEWCDADPSRALVWVSHRGHEVQGLVTRSLALAELGR
ncbi:MAG: ABC transporter ATP-binding protein [Gemmatimonadota bacterium]